MFKKYRIKVGKSIDGKPLHADFFVRSKSRRGGFMHEAVCIGPLPDAKLWDAFKPKCPPRERTDALFKLRYARIGYCNRTYEMYNGQDACARLWEQLAKSPDLEMPDKNPFRGKKEPKYEEMPVPDELFGRFK